MFVDDFETVPGLGFALFLAEDVLRGIPKKRRAEILLLAHRVLETWKEKHGRVFVRKGGLFMPPVGRRLTPKERTTLAPWKCAGPDLRSPAGLLLKLRRDGWQPLRTVIKREEQDEFLFEAMLAVLMPESARPESYFEARATADWLTTHLLARTSSSGQSTKRAIANRQNASQLRAKVKAGELKGELITDELVRRKRDAWRADYPTRGDHGFVTSTALAWGVNRATIEARIASIDKTK